MSHRSVMTEQEANLRIAQAGWFTPNENTSITYEKRPVEGGFEVAVTVNGVAGGLLAWEDHQSCLACGHSPAWGA